MKKLITIVLLALLFGILLWVPGTAEAATSAVPVYRLYNKSTQEHLFTTSKNEYDTLPDYGWRQEGCAWVAPKTGKGVYRLYNPKTSDHHYTADANECKVLTTQYGWVYDNNQKPLFYSGGTIPVYRLYKKSLKIGSHHFTKDVNEYKTLPKYGWKQEGIAFYAVKHEHKWVAITKEEPIYEWVSVCWCGVIRPSREHTKQHAFNGEPTNVSTKTVQTGTKTVIVGYKCSDCGAVK